MLRSIKRGGVKVSDDLTLMPDPILVGRNEAKLKALCEAHGVTKYSTDLDAVLADKSYEIFFDASATTCSARGSSREGREGPQGDLLREADRDDD